MKVHKLLDDGQTHAGPGTIADIGRAMKSLIELAEVRGGNPNARVAHEQLNVLSGWRLGITVTLPRSAHLFDLQKDGLFLIGIFNRVAQEITQDMAQDPLIKPGLARSRIKGKFDQTSVADRPRNFRDDLSAKCFQIDPRSFALHFPARSFSCMRKSSII